MFLGRQQCLVFVEDLLEGNRLQVLLLVGIDDGFAKPVVHIGTDGCRRNGAQGRGKRCGIEINLIDGTVAEILERSEW